MYIYMYMHDVQVLDYFQYTPLCEHVCVCIYDVYLYIIYTYIYIYIYI